MTGQTDPEDTIAVTVDRVVYHQADRGFAVVRVVSEDGGAFSAAGNFLLLPTPGETLTLVGSFDRHPKFGRQFKVVAARPRIPTTADGVRRYLGSGRVKGIGKKLAERLVAHFGGEALRILEEEPERVLEVPGVGKKKFDELRQSFADGKEQRETLVFLQGLGLGPALSTEIWRRLGADAAAAVRADPYALAGSIAGVGFTTADRLGQSLGIALDAPSRLRAGLRHCLDEATKEGHVCLDHEELVQRACRLLAADRSLVTAQVADAVTREQLRVVRRRDPSAPIRVYVPFMLATELEVAERLLALARGQRPTPRSGDGIPFSDDEVPLSEEQRAAVKMLLRTKVGVLTGGPGVGKTTVLRTVVAAYERVGFRVALASPTGRASRRLAEATGREASTLHRLFGLLPGGAIPDRRTDIEMDVLVIDEMSMVDLPLFLRVLRRVPDHAILLFIGDPDQLPSVGPGAVLADLLSSGVIETARLTRVFRQQTGGLIVENAHRILKGELPILALGEQESDYYFTERKTAEAGAQLIERLFLERIPEVFGMNPRRDIQVLSPMYRGAAGVDALNERLQRRLFEGTAHVEHRGRRYHGGDRVLQTRNDYDRDLMNGDMGFVEMVEPENGRLSARFEDRVIDFDRTQLDDLEIAYALTVHKSQGGEFPAVIVPLFTEHALMLRRAVLYTACTRAQRLLVLVGQRRALEIAVQKATELVRNSELRAALLGIPLEDVPLETLG